MLVLRESDLILEVQKCRVNAKRKGFEKLIEGYRHAMMVCRADAAVLCNPINSDCSGV